MSLDTVPEFYLRALDYATIQGCRDGAQRDLKNREGAENVARREGITYDILLKRRFHERLFRAYEQRTSQVPVICQA